MTLLLEKWPAESETLRLGISGARLGAIKHQLEIWQRELAAYPAQSPIRIGSLDPVDDQAGVVGMIWRTGSVLVDGQIDAPPEIYSDPLASID